MSFQSMLNHTCDIYHIKRSDTSPGYNLPDSPSFSYPQQPDIAGLRCHFSIRGQNGGLRVQQNEPFATLDGRRKLSVPKGTDIRINDKIVHIETGYEYIAEAPTQIRNHHTIVMLRRTNKQVKI